MVNHKKNIKLLLLFLAVLILFVFLGGLFSYFYFYKNYSFFRDLNLNSWEYDQSSFVIQDAKNVVITQDLKIDENINYFSEVVLGLFKKNNNNNYVYNFNENLLSGIVISSDGWVLMNIYGLNSFDKNILLNKESYFLLSQKNKKNYEIEDVFYSEKNNLLFIKIDEVNNFPVKSFVKFSDLKIGQTLTAYNFAGNIEINYLSSKTQDINSINLDNFNNKLIFNQKLSESFKNSFIFDLNGDLTALVTADLKIYPISDFSFNVFSFFKEKELKDIKFGLTYVDLSNSFSFNKNFYSEGAWVYNDGLPAVEKGLIFDLAGVKTGDIIIRANNYKIDKENKFFDILNNFTYGDKLNLYVIRDNKEIELEVELK